MSDYNLTLFEACEYLNRSKKSISRYIRRGLLHPQQIKSQQGTLEYRFSESELKAFKENVLDKSDLDETEQTGQQEAKEITDTTKKKEKILDKGQTEETGRQDSEIINLLKETTGLLKEQLVKKDEQIKDLGGKIDELIQRDRETNILIGQLQSKVLMLEQPKEKKTRQTKPKAEAKTPEKKGFWQRIFK